MKRCHTCGREWAAGKKQPAVKDFCEGCTAYLHCCLNCRFYDPAKHNQCAIGTTDWVGDKAGANFCDEFEFLDVDVTNAENAAADKARSALEGLFGTKETPADSERLDNFRKLFEK